jgi:hypothetical protein
MRIFFFLIVLTIAISSCTGNGSASKTFCDTACKADSFKFTSNNAQQPFVVLSLKNCAADTVTWSHKYQITKRQIDLPTVFDQPIHVNRAAMDCYIKDTLYAWLKFNDCKTGRGYLLKLTFDPKQAIGKISGAVNSFDPKFAVEQNLVAYTDRGTIYVEDVTTGKKEAMSFKERYPIDFDHIHEVLDSVNITHHRIFVQLIKNEQKVPMEKAIDL